MERVTNIHSAMIEPHFLIDETKKIRIFGSFFTLPFFLTIGHFLLYFSISTAITPKLVPRYLSKVPIH